MTVVGRNKPAPAGVSGMMTDTAIKLGRHTGKDAGIQAMDGNLTVVQVLHLGNLASVARM